MIKTGYKRLDEVLGGGINKGGVTIIAGRPGMHEDELALNIASGFAKGSYKTLVFSNLNSENNIKDEITKICEKKGDDKEKLMDYEEFFIINDSAYLTPKYIEEQYEKMSEKSNDISAIIIESFNDIICDNWREIHKGTALSEKINRDIVMNELRRIARDKNIAFIVCINLDRKIESRKDHRPYLEDLKRIISHECFPDNIIMMYQESCYSTNPTEEGSNKVEVTVAISRNTCCQRLYYNYDYKTHSLTEEKE